MRTAVLSGHRPDGLGAIIYHGMWQGLAVLLDGTGGTFSLTKAAAPAAVPFAEAHDRQLVRLLANMVLAASSQVHHAY
ncbi:MAG TPA: hypothetical protein VHJ55_12525 [Casimicrobiaceae bacterium]|nr:hypothetical protein [Casimicrobiaceae bacterium]